MLPDKLQGLLLDKIGGIGGGFGPVIPLQENLLCHFPKDIRDNTDGHSVDSCSQKRCQIPASGDRPPTREIQDPISQRLR